MIQALARIEKDRYQPKNRRFNKSTDIRWRVVYQNPDSLGVKKESYRSEEDAMKRVEALKKLPSNELRYASWTVKDAANFWEEKKLCNLKSKRVELIRTTVIKKLLGDIKLSDLSETHISRFKGFLQKEKVRTPRTVNSYLVTLRTLLNYAKRKGVCEKVPDISEYIDSALEVKRDRVLTPEEFERLLAACHIKNGGGRARVHLIPYLLWLHETACRTGELAKVEAKDIDLDRGLVRIWSGKSKRAVQRECGITPRLRKLIVENPSTGGLLFPQREWKKAFATACKIARIEGLTMHDLRRSGITNMLEKGIPLHLVAKMVGHSSGSILTLDVYTKFRSDFIQEMMAKMG